MCSQLPKWAGLVLGSALLVTMSMQAANALPLTPGDSSSLQQASHSKKAPFYTFGSLELRTKGGRFAREWNRLQKKVRGERKTYRKCSAGNANCHRKVRAWRRAMKRMKSLKGYDLLAAANGKINSLVRYADDIKQFGRRDYWASPIESLTGRGDCEDYVTLKYFTLAELGVPEDSMRIMIVQDTVRRIGHAVLAVKMNGKTYILDSLRNRPSLHTAIKRYRPFYSLNRRGNWINVAARKRSKTRVAAVRASGQTPQQAQALLPDYAKNQKRSKRSVVLRGSLSLATSIQ